jgi:phosphoribosylglycinamide formyltransferase-1
MKRIVILASGSGTNAEQIIKYFYYHESITVAAVFSNRADAGVLQRAHKYGIPAVVFSRTDLYEEKRVEQLLRDFGADLIVLAGFLWLIPEAIVKQYPNRILNIHPALLPRYGGKGMYGNKVHKAVIADGEKESGITIHYVNKHYDKGDIIHQETCPVSEGETPETLAAKIHRLEHEAYPSVIESVAMGL